MQKEYTCPMHPQVIQSTPGSCPLCGMALELKTGGSEDALLKTMSRRFYVSAFLTIPLLFLVNTGISLGKYGPWMQWLLATPVVFWSGWPLLLKGWRSIITRHLNMFTLVSLGVCAAYFYSVVAVLCPSIFPFSHQIDLYFEAASVITGLVLLGQLLEIKARVKTGLAISKLLGLAPKTARVILNDKTEKDIPLEEVKKGDILRVRPGEKIPTDGVMIQGESLIDTSMISGEPFPIKKISGDTVIGATVSHGSFIMQAEHIGQETLLARIVHLVSEAQRSRAPIQKLADLIASYFVPAVMLAALTTFLIWGFFIPSPRLSLGLVNAIAVLIIACPCALGLATPMSIMVGIGQGALSGLLIRDAEALEMMAKVDTLLIDKTGTLTEGKPTLTKIICLSKESDNEILQIAASLEIASEHPLAAPIVTAAKTKNLPLLPVKNFKNVKGKGLVGEIEGIPAAIGNPKLFADLHIDPSAALESSEEISKEAQIVFYLALNHKIIGILAMADAIKKSTPEVIAMLHQDHIRIVMVTGDSTTAATAIGKSLKLDEIVAEILPEDKYKIVQQLQSEGHIVAMAGDGINDAPALAQADVGIAMGTGTDIAMESAEITLIKGDLRGIARARRLSQDTVRNIKQNLCFAFIYNALGIPIAAGILYPAFGILLNPMIASAAMVLSSVSVIINALRIQLRIRH